MKVIMAESPSKSHSSSKTSTTRRRINKPLMERKRRARINESLNELKSLVLTGMKKDPTRYNRLEKADILEMTVSHLKSLQRQQVRDSMKKSPEIVSKYQAGFSECASEVTSYLNQTSDLDSEVRAKIVSHLSQCKKRIGDSVSLTTSMHPEVFKRHRQDSDSNSSDEENIPVKRTYCSSIKEQKEQQCPQIPLQCVNQHYTPGLIQLPTGVQVVLIPKDLLLKSNTCAQGISSAFVQKKEMDEVPSSCVKDDLNQCSSSDSEPDSTMPCDTVIEVKVTTDLKETDLNKITNNTQNSPQESALDLSAQRNRDENESMWRPW